jgi:hypothetical protein
MFYTSKGHVLQCKRAPFRKQKMVFKKTKGILFYKREQPYAVEKIKELKVKRI